MGESRNIRTGRHCVYNLHVHLVFIAKYRKKIFTKLILEDMKACFEKVCTDFEATLMEFDGEHDHVHLLVFYPPKVSISKLVNSLKGVSARLLRKKKYPTIESSLWGDALWSPSYFASSCGGAPLDVVKDYIRSQKTPT